MVSLSGPCQFYPARPPARPAPLPGSARRLRNVGKNHFRHCVGLGGRYHPRSLHRGLRGSVPRTIRPSSGGDAQEPRKPDGRLGRREALYGLTSFRRSSPGSLAKFAAMRRASCLVSLLVAERRPGFSSK